MTGDISLSHHLDESQIAGELQRALRETVFSSGLRISPRRLSEIAGDMAHIFLGYVADADDTAPSRLGQQLADDGLAPKSVVAVTDRLRMVASKASNSIETLPEVVAGFCAALLIGFMVTREEIILLEAERTHRAYLAAKGSQ